MNERLNTQDFVDLLGEKHGMSKKHADEFVKEFFLLIEEALEIDGCVKIKGLGTFKLINIDSRESVKVNTGERFQILGHTKVSFTPDTALRDTINKPFSHFETVVLNENTVLEDTPVESREEEQEEDSDEMPEVIKNVVSEIEVIENEAVSTVVPETVILETLMPKTSDAVEKDHPDSPVEILQTENLSSQLSAENIIATELRRAELEFRTVRVVKQEMEQLPPRETEPLELKVEKKEKPATPYLIVIILLVLLLCGSALLLVYYPDLFSDNGKQEIVQASAPQPIVKQEPLLDTLLKDTVAEAVPEMQKPPTKPLKEAVKQPKEESNTTAKPGVPLNLDSVNYKISGTKTTYTVKEGETLTRISQRFYGVKECWPYIVQYNKDVIKNPDHVPFGTVLKIPELVEK